MKRNPKCRLCSLHESASTVCLMGHGKVPSKVMLFGEAPGAKEDECGLPFQGRAGDLLNRLLKDAGLSREKVYIANPVRCRPPDNRSPSNKEIKACSVYTPGEIEKVNPKYVILMGATALKAVLGEKGITEKHGSIIKRDGITYLPTFHPAAALHDPKRFGPLQEDFKKFGRIIAGKSEKKTPLNIIEIVNRRTFDACLKDIVSSDLVSFDTETTGLDPRADGAAINTLQIGTRATQWILPLEISWSPWKGDRKAQLHMVKAIAQAIKKVDEVTGQNAKFDNLFLWILYGVRFKLTFDTMLSSHILDENSPSGLKYRAKVDLGAPDYDIEADEKKGGGAISKEKFMVYGASDVYYTRKLALNHRKRLRSEEGLWNLFTWLIMPAARVLEKIEFEGLYINQKQKAEVRKQLVKNISVCERRLKMIADINWGSPDQVAEVLFKKLRMKVLDYTPGGKPSTAETVMKQLAEKHPAPSLLLQLRGYQKQLSTYVDGWDPLMHGDRVYLGLRLNGTVTGRLSSRLHQVPRDPLIRSLIDAPPGWVFWSADFSQIELRIAALFAGDVAMIELFKTGADIHLATAAEILGKHPDDVTKEERKMAKAINFGLIYGMSYRKLTIYARDKYEVIITDNQSKQFRNRFFGKYSGLLPWHDRVRRLVAGEGRVRSPIGRIRRLPEIYSPDEGLRKQAERNAINSPVQGFASDLKLMSLVEIDRVINWSDCKIVGEVHDAILGMVRKEKADFYLKKIKAIMESPPLLKKFGVKIPFPIVADVEIGPWGKGKPWS